LSYNPAEGFPRIMPSLVYRDVGAAIVFLARAFGLKEHLRWTDAEGQVLHAEMRIDGAYIELSAVSEGMVAPVAGQTSQLLVVMVDDVDRHYRLAQSAGARILREPADRPWGLRQYRAEDPEGHCWEFSQFLRDVPPAEWGATLAR
jgi:uncharacterized glyoxalase superfamily protein PhnB